STMRSDVDAKQIGAGHLTNLTAVFATTVTNYDSNFVFNAPGTISLAPTVSITGVLRVTGSFSYGSTSGPTAWSLQDNTPTNSFSLGATNLMQGNVALTAYSTNLPGLLTVVPTSSSNANLIPSIGSAGQLPFSTGTGIGWSNAPSSAAGGGETNAAY